MHNLEEILGVKVDLATPNALRMEMREQILKEAIRAAWGLETAGQDDLPPLVEPLRKLLEHEV